MSSRTIRAPVRAAPWHYRLVRWLLALCLLVPRLAAADPGARAFDACKAQRKAGMAAAMREPDLDKRTRMLEALPDCIREPDGTLVVEDPNAPRPPPPPFTPHAWVGLEVGAAASYLAYEVNPASAIDPFLDVDAAWHLRRRLSLGVFAGAEHFEDHSYLGTYDVSHMFYEVGARAWFHFGPARLGAGAGALIDDGRAYADIPATTSVDLLATVTAAYDLAHTGGFTVTASAEFAYAQTPHMSPSDFAIYGDALSGRLAVGLRY